MKTLAILLLLGLAIPARALPVPEGTVTSASTGRATHYLAGRGCIAASTTTQGTCTIQEDGPSGGVDASSFTAKFGVKATTGVFSGAVTAGSFAGPLTGAVTGNVTGNLTGNVTGNLTGNVTGNVTGDVTGNSTTATTATNLAAGAAGKIAYQSGAGATAFLPAMAAGGIITGNGTSAIPSTGTLTGTVSQVTVTRTNSDIALSLPATINVNTSGNAATSTAFDHTPTGCSAGNYPTSIAASGNFGGCTTAGSGDMTKSAANSVTGSIVMAASSSMTITQVTSISGSSITILNAPTVSGMWTTVASSFTNAGVQGWSFLGFESSTTYKVIWMGALSIASSVALKINDSGTSGDYTWTGLAAANASSVVGGSASDTRCYLFATATNYLPNANEMVTCEIQIGNYAGRITAQSRCSSVDAAADYFSWSSMCRFKAASTFTSLRIEPVVSLTQMRGDIMVQRLWR